MLAYLLDRQVLPFLTLLIHNTPQQTLDFIHFKMKQYNAHSKLQSLSVLYISCYQLIEDLNYYFETFLIFLFFLFFIFL